MVKKFKNNSAITLISLVITIVVLIILASVGIYLSLGNNGIFTRAKEAKERTNKQTATEIINLKITTAQMNKYAEEQRMPTLKELSLVFGNDNEIEYVTEQSKKRASTEYNVQSENPSSIFTKLNKYPYEFEINSSLQLASINGIKIIASTSENTNGSNPKLLSTLTLPGSNANYRNIGEYYANTINFQKSNTSILDNYLLYNEDNGWIVQKSGYYLINSDIAAGAPANGSTRTYNYMCINDDTLKLNTISLIPNTINMVSSSTTLYLEKGSTINFYSSIQDNNSNWHSTTFFIYALFN